MTVVDLIRDKVLIILLTVDWESFVGLFVLSVSHDGYHKCQWLLPMVNKWWIHSLLVMTSADHVCQWWMATVNGEWVRADESTECQWILPSKWWVLMMNVIQMSMNLVKWMTAVSDECQWRLSTSWWTLFVCGVPMMNLPCIVFQPDCFVFDRLKKAVLIQKCYRAYRARRFFLELRAKALELYQGKKQRRKNSVQRYDCSSLGFSCMSVLFFVVNTLQVINN